MGSEKPDTFGKPDKDIFRRFVHERPAPVGNPPTRRPPLTARPPAVRPPSAPSPDSPDHDEGPAVT